MFKLKYLFLIVFIFTSKLIDAQIFNIEGVSSFSFSNKSNLEKNFQNVLNILKEYNCNYADSNLLLICRYKINVKANADNNTILNWKTIDFHYSKNINCNEFLLNSSFVPSSIIVDIVFQLKSKKEIVQKSNPIGLNYITSFENVININDIIDVNQIENIKIIINSLQFSQSKILNFEKIINIKKWFQKSDSTINSLKKDIENIKDDAVELSPLYDLELCKIENSLMQIEQMEVLKILNQNNQLAKKFILNFDTLFSRYNYKRNKVNYNLSNYDKLLLNKALNLLIKNDYENSLYYINKALDFNRFYVPAFILWAKVDFKTGNAYNAAQRIAEIYENCYPSPSQQIEINQIADSIYFKYYDKCNVLINQNRQLEAQKLNIELKEVCLLIKHPKCENSIDNVDALSKIGIYNSYIVVATKALSKKIPDLTEKYLLEALNYAEKNKNINFNNAEYNVLQQNLIELYFELLDKSLKNKEIEKSKKYIQRINKLNNVLQNSSYFEKINNIVSNLYKDELNQKIELVNEAILLNDIYFTEKRILEFKDFISNKSEFSFAISIVESFEKKLAQMQYNQKIVDAQRFVYYEFYNSAYNSLIEAIDISKKYQISTHENFDYLLKITSKFVIIDNINKCKLIAWNKNIEKSKSQYEEIIKSINKVNLQEDSLIKVAINELKELINKSECEVFQSKISNHYNKVLVNVNDKNFINAKILMESLLLDLNSNQKCQIEKSDYLKYYEKLKYAEFYQQRYKSAIIESSRANFLKSFQIIDSMIVMNENPILEDFNMDKVEIESFILNRSNIPLLYSGCEYFLLQNKPLLAFECLRKLKSLGVIEKDVENLQINTAIKLRNTEKFLLNDEIESNLWYKTFVKTYKKKNK